MGAMTFFEDGAGSNAQEAFNNAVEHSRWENGHGGYTGTLAEKNEFVMIPVPNGEDPYGYAEYLIQESDPRINDKWGPAGCIVMGGGRYLFFGWASS